MARRRFQEPKLHWDARLERWEVRYREDVLDATTGVTTRIRKKAFFSKAEYQTKILAQKALGEILAPINATTYKPRRVITFADFAQRWMESVLPTHKPNTRPTERGIILKYLLPAFGKMQMQDITNQVLQTWVTKLAAEGQIGGKTISNIIGCLSTMWQSKEGGNAKNWGLVSHNPFEGLRKPHIGEAETYAYTEEETVAIINAFEGQNQNQLILWTLAEIGARPGEIPALKISSIDFEGSKLKIAKAVSRNHEIGTTKGRAKSKGKKRSAVLSADLLVALGEFIGDRAGEELLFSENGKMVDMIKLRERLDEVLTKLGIRTKVKAMGIDQLGFYAFRHFSATEAARKGLPLKTAMLRLGHSKPETHMLYNHGIDAAEQAFANSLGATLKPHSRKNSGTEQARV